MKDNKNNILCDHCGDLCLDTHIQADENDFCCQACEMVYELLATNGLDSYYRLNEYPGIQKKENQPSDFEYLSDPEVVKKLVQFTDGKVSRVEFLLPQIHCSSCLYLLENLAKLSSGVRTSRVNFYDKKCTIIYEHDLLSLKDLVALLSKIGYTPKLSLDELNSRSEPKIDRSLLYKLGLAGFSFGNIMLLSFPEYLGFYQASHHFYIGFINILLAIPVVFYAGWDYIRSAVSGIRISQVNIDLPISIGIAVLFLRSLYEIIGGVGEGYLDSLSGFIFFLLIGRWYQAISYRSIDFDRNYKSFFPISVQKLINGKWSSCTLTKLKVGDIIRVNHGEIIPADGNILEGKAAIDYSFVTGEEKLVPLDLGQEVFAGGKQTKGSIKVSISRTVDQSYLTKLWKEDTFSVKSKSTTEILIENVSRYFTIVILLIAAGAFVYWNWKDPTMAFQVVTAVLIVACPCALALSIPFTFGNMLRLLSNFGVYLKSTKTILNFQEISHVVFDKTGTLTDSTKIKCTYEGEPLNAHQKSQLLAIVSQSNHPLSRSIAEELQGIKNDSPNTTAFEEHLGKGISASIEGNNWRIGSPQWLGDDRNRKSNEKYVLIEYNGHILGYFLFNQPLRENIQSIIHDLSDQFELSLLSGDGYADLERMTNLFPPNSTLLFQQSPKNKLDHIQQLQDQGHTVLMIGDGLNDAGALRQSDVGLVISDDINNFAPACDGLIAAEAFVRFQSILNYISSGKALIYTAFTIAILYNAMGLYFAVRGVFSPIIAAILMPLSSITIIVFGIASSHVLWRIKPLARHVKARSAKTKYKLETEKTDKNENLINKPKMPLLDDNHAWL